MGQSQAQGARVAVEPPGRLHPAPGPPVPRSYRLGPPGYHLGAPGYCHWYRLGYHLGYRPGWCCVRQCWVGAPVVESKWATDGMTHASPRLVLLPPQSPATTAGRVPLPPRRPLRLRILGKSSRISSGTSAARCSGRMRWTSSPSRTAAAGTPAAAAAQQQQQQVSAGSKHWHHCCRSSAPLTVRCSGRPVCWLSMSSRGAEQHHQTTTHLR